MPQWQCGTKARHFSALWVLLFCFLRAAVTCVSCWTFISLWLSLFCLEKVNLMAWDVKNLLILMVLILVSRCCYLGNFISCVFIIISPFFPFLKVFLFHDGMTNWKHSQNKMYRLKQRKAKKMMLKYLFKVLKGLHQWLNLFGLNKDFLNAAIHFHFTWECFWHHAFVRNMNSDRSLIEFALNLLIT